MIIELFHGVDRRLARHSGHLFKSKERELSSFSSDSYDYPFSSFREASYDGHHRGDERMEQQDLHHIQKEDNRERLRAFL